MRTWAATHRTGTGMKVKRIVANIATDNVAAAAAFYRDLLGLELLMDHGWLATYGSAESMRVQVGIASEGGSGRRYRTCRSKSTTSTQRWRACARRMSQSSTDRPMSPGASGASTCAIRSGGWSTS
jgi:hypothetical protein